VPEKDYCLDNPTEKSRLPLPFGGHNDKKYPFTLSGPLMQTKDISKLLIKLAFSISIMAVLLSRTDISSVMDMVHHFNPVAWALSAGAVVTQFFLITYRWMILINIGHRRMTFRQAAEVTAASLVANSLFIAAITGIFVRVAMSLHYGASLFKSVMGTLVDRLMTLAALLFISGLFLPFLDKYISDDLYKQVCVYVGVFVVLTFVMAPAFFSFLLRYLPRLPFEDRHIRAGTRYLTILLGDYKTLGRVAISSLIAQISFFVSVYIITLSTPISISFLDLMTVLPLITLVASLPISFGGWGVREGAFIYGLGLLGVPFETAFLISVQTGLIGLMATIVIGLPILMTAKTNFSSLPKVPNLKKILVKK
jgi:uncharacterized membrane protein YbhN (UPF0104 family)